MQCYEDGAINDAVSKFRFLLSQIILESGPPTPELLDIFSAKETVEL